LRASSRASKRGTAALSWFRGALPLVLGLCSYSTGAFAVDEPKSSGEAQFQVGARDEAAGDYARALEHYRASLTASGSGRLARNARKRIVWIEERSQGGFAPLAALGRLRHEPAVLEDPAASVRLAAEVESFPPGPVRSEIRLRLAQAWLRQPMRRAEALGELRRIVSDPSAGAADAVLAERALVEALLAAGQLDDARQEVLAHPFDAPSTANVARRFHLRSQRRTVEVGLIALAILTIAAVARMRAQVVRRCLAFRSAQIQGHDP
jgi:hypothetical protein